MNTSKQFAFAMLIFLSMKSFASQNNNPTRFFDSNCHIVEAKRKELIDWNLRISKAGVETFSSFPKVTKSAKGCEIDLNQFIPKRISEKNYPGFNSQSETNCHGSTRYFSGWSSRLERALGFSPATYFRSLCQEIDSPEGLRAGDIGLIQSTKWIGDKELNLDIHSFTYLSPGAVLQSPGMETGQYPRVASFHTPMDDYVTQTRNPELNPKCQLPGADRNKCKTWVRYYRCDFASPSCLGDSSKNSQRLLVTVEEAIGRNKQTCSICRGDREENYCSTETKKLQIQRGKLQDLEERIRGMNSWEQLAEVALKPLDAEVMNVVHRLADIEQIEDPAERKSLALIFLELENLREVITDKTSDLEKQKKQRPTNLGRDFERLSSGLNFSVDQPKEPQFSFDLLTCLQLKLSKSNAVMPLENCSAVFRAIGF